MSIQGISTTSSNATLWSANRQQQPPAITKDRLSQLETKMKSEGKDTTTLDKILSSFDTLDADGDGTLTASELQQGAAQQGIQLPQGPHHGHRRHKKIEDASGANAADATAPLPPPTDNSVDILI
jgi:hypothetical protein